MMLLQRSTRRWKHPLLLLQPLRLLRLSGFTTLIVQPVKDDDSSQEEGSDTPSTGGRIVLVLLISFGPTAFTTCTPADFTSRSLQQAAFISLSLRQPIWTPASSS